MNLFDSVKAAVTPRMAAERYGVPIQQGSMVCCPFHADRTPSRITSTASAAGQLVT